MNDLYLEHPLYSRLRRLLPPGLRHRLWLMSETCVKALTWTASRIGPTLPTWLSVSVKDGLRPVRRLDYPHATIRMSVGSLEELERTRACRKEPETVAWLRANMAAGLVLYDIGANVGAYSFVADAISQGKGSVYAFEPSYPTFASLCRNILLNECQHRIVPLMFALSSETRMVTLTFSSIAPGAASHAIGLELDSLRPSLSIPSYRLDELAHTYSLPLPNLIKLDVDGDELGVLKGSTAVLNSRTLRSILVEVDEQKPSCAAIHELLLSSGFHLATRHPHGGTASVANHVFVRE